MSEVAAAQSATEQGLHDAPALQYELEPWAKVFSRNLADLLLRREPPPVEVTAEPIPVPPDTFIRTGISWWRFAESYGGHIVFVIAVYFISTSALFHRPVKLQSPFENTEISYYPVSEYLPPIRSEQAGLAKPRKGQPKLAKQEILSVPPSPDNNHQTIVTPPQVKLNRDVPLPNIVAWTPVASRQPIAASSPSVSQLKIPQFQQQVVEPAPDVSGLKPKLLVPPELRPTVVEPRADVSALNANLKAPSIAQPSAVEPPVTADQLKLQRGQLNMAQLQPQVEAPKLPVGPQRATAGTGTAQANAGQPAPAQPSLQGLGTSRGQGQIIALGLNPGDVHGPIEVPAGNRSGEFHASPGGKPDAPGTPDIKGNQNATANGTGGGQGKGSGSGGGSGNGLPPGITVGNPPPGATTAAVAGTPNQKAVDPKLEEQKRIIAAAMNPSIASVTRRPIPAPEPPPTLDTDSIESRVFGKKIYYSLVLNTPNLSSAAGSWIIHFAELKQTEDKSKPTAPVAVNEVDPGYTAEAMRDRVEGTVTLYAVIRADGTVSDIKVLNSLDDRLDSSAMRALSRWKFRPATKNGEAIALEAVVQIPFRLHSIR
jgi:TonB family protein